MNEALYCRKKEEITVSNPRPKRQANTKNVRKTSGAKGTRSSAVLVHAPAGGTAKRSILLDAKTFGVLSPKAKSVAGLLKRYSAAVERSQRTGLVARFTVSVPPKGEPTIKSVEMTVAQPKKSAVASAGSALELALTSARDRGRVRVGEILSGNDMLSADDFAKLLGITRVTVNTRRQNHQLLGLEGAKRGFRFPEWQVDTNGKPFDALPALFERLGGSPWAVYRFLVQHHAELQGLSGRDALRRGRSARVLEAAESVARAFA